MSNNPEGFDAVIQGPTSSTVRELARERGVSVNDLTPAALVALHREVMEAYKEVGATIGVAGTYGFTTFRASDNPRRDLVPSTTRLDPKHHDLNKRLIDATRDVFDGNHLVAASVMPITNTSGFHDGFWKSLGEEERIEWAGARQAPHLQSILSANPDMVIVEATRYIGEAIGIVRKMQEFGGKMLGVSFEANKNGVPLPLDGEPRTFAGISALLNEEAGPDLTVFVGANCAGVSVITPILERRDTLDYVYPNRADFNGDQASYARFVQLELKGKRRSAKEEGEFLT